MKNLSICLLVLGLAVLGCDNKPTTPAKPATPTTSHSPMGHAHAPAAAVDKKDDAPAVDKKPE